MISLVQKLRFITRIQRKKSVIRRQRGRRAQAAEQLELRQLLSATLVADINRSVFVSGPELFPDSRFTGKSSVAFNDAFYYAEGTSVWKLTAAGTEELVDVAPGKEFASIRWMQVSGDRLYFSGEGRLWVSDGTSEGTRAFFQNSNLCRSPEQLVDVNGTLFFIASAPGTGFELWTSDGSEEGTRMVVDLVPGPDDSNTSQITKVGNAVFFVTSVPETGAGYELWRSDGTAAGTQLVADIVPGVNSSFPQKLVAAGNRLYFTVSAFADAPELWTSDGTATGTVPVRGPSSNRFISTGSGCALGDVLLLVGSDSAGSELWRADGDSARPVKDIRPGSAGSLPYSLTTSGNLAYFLADDGVNGRELWSSDGTELGTQLISDVNILDETFPNILATAAGLVFFTANDGINGTEIWRTDGTANGTILLADINPGANSGISSSSLLKADGTLLYFTADDGVNSRQIWLSDGTSAGTRMASTPRKMELGGNPAYLTDIDGTLYFAARSAGIESAGELWKSDGTPEGTVQIKDLSPDGAPGFLLNFKVLNGSWYSAAFRH